MEGIPVSLPDDIAVQIVALLQVSDLCALGSCSRFWRELCGSEYLWESLARRRWPFLTTEISKEWRSFYVGRHNEVLGRANGVVKFVEQCSSSSSLEVRDYLKAIEDLRKMQLGFEDVQMFLFKPKHNVILNLVGLHYCINWLGVPAKHVVESLESYKISEREVCVKWWKLGRWFRGFRMRDEEYSRRVSLGDLAMAKEEKVRAVLHRGAIHEVLRIQISLGDSVCTSWSFQSIQRQD